MRLEDVTAGARILRIAGDAPVTVVAVTWIGDNALRLTGGTDDEVSQAAIPGVLVVSSLTASKASKLGDKECRGTAPERSIPALITSGSWTVGTGARSGGGIH
jgi:hypothetical protein